MEEDVGDTSKGEDMGSKRFWVGRRCIVGLVGILAVSVVSCSSDSNENPALGDATIRSVEVVTEGGDFADAIDATVTPDGRDIFFTAAGPQGRGVFRVPASGGTALPIFTGAPFAGPVGVATDGERAYVADPAAETAGGRGAILALPLAGGAPTAVPGTEGSAPRGLEVVREGDTETVYFTGVDKADGTVGVFKIPAAGAEMATTVTRGAPLTSPDAVTVNRAGVVYVTDRGRDDRGGGVFRVDSTPATKVADMRAPVLAGVALNLDESLLLVSSLSAEGTDQVLLVDLASGDKGVFSKVIGENRAGGGLHRARDAEVFAWADVQRPGRVYRIDP